MRNLAELREVVKNIVTKENIVEAIIYRLYEMTKENKQNILLETIPKSQTILQTVFFNLKKKVPSLFTDFIFDESGVTPFSDDLDTVLFRLEASTILPALNPSYKNYDIAESIDILQASYEKLKSDKEKIDKCAEYFRDFLVKQQAELQ